MARRVGIMTLGEAPSFPSVSPSSHQLQYTPVNSDRRIERRFIENHAGGRESWRGSDRARISFSLWKASKFIHLTWKRLSDKSVRQPRAARDTFIVYLARKPASILFQLPPQFQADAERLASFFKLLSKKRRYSFDFVTRAGMRQRYFRCSASRISHFAFRPPDGPRRRGTPARFRSTSGATPRWAV